MEGKSNNKLLIIVIVVLSLCVLGLSGYLVYDKVLSKKEPVPTEDKGEKKATNYTVKEPTTSLSSEEEYQKFVDKQKNSITNEELLNSLDKSNTEDALVKNEIKKLFAYTNGEVEIESMEWPCMYLSTVQGVNYNDMLFSRVPHIMECMHDMTYVKVDDNLYNGSKLMTQDQYELLKEYFVNPPELEDLDSHWNDSNVDKGENGKFYEAVKPYLGKNYRYAYGVGDGFGFSEFFFKENGIVRNGNKYEVNVEVYTEERNDGVSSFVKYTGILELEIVNGHVKYHELKLNKA